MKTSSLANFEMLPVPVVQRVDDVCDRFEAAWSSADARCPRPRIEDFLGDTPEPARSILLRELIAIEVGYRHREGEHPRPGDYQARFPLVDPEWLAGEFAEPARTVTVGDRRLLGKFQLFERVGMGAFGEVWRARDTELDRMVALKLSHVGPLSSPVFLERFFREARAAAQLRHPGIVTVYEATMLDGQPVIVSEFIDGVSLKDLLEVRRLTFRETAELVAEAAEALDYAHNLGLVHRDVKPANIMIAAEATARGPRPRIVDFGLALREEAEVTMTVDGQIIGTPAYMSPEQASGKGHRVDRRSDVYSLGVVLYEMLCGEVPFQGSKAMLLQRVQSEEPRPPRRVQERIPRDLETICLKALAKERNRRYASARDLAADLKRFLDGDPIHARPMKTWERTMRWAKRRPALVALLVGIGLVAVIGFLGVLWQWRQAVTARRELETNHYFHSIALAEREWWANNMSRVDGLLEECPARLRGWEWDYVKGLRHGNRTPLQHASAVFGVAFSPDGRRLASTGMDGTVKIWDTATGNEVLTLKAHAVHARAVAFSPDGRRLASSSTDKTVKVWDVSTGQEIFTLRGHTQGVVALAYCPDGAWIASASTDKTIKVWDAATGQEIRTLHGHTEAIWGVAFSPDGRRLASGSLDKTVKIWNVANGEAIHVFHGHTLGVVAVAFSPDGQRIASASGAIHHGTDDGEVIVWDIRSGKPFLTLGGQACSIWSVAFSPNGRRLASAGYDQTVKIWDVATGLEAIALRGHTDVLRAVAFSADGRRLASAGHDGTIRIWDATPLEERPPQECRTLHGHRGRVLSTVYSPDGRRIASAGVDQTVRIWDTATGNLIHQLGGHVNQVITVAFSPDGQFLASGSLDGTVKVWDATKGKERLVFDKHRSKVLAVAFHPNGQYIASTGFDKEVKVWNAITGEEFVTLGGRDGHQWVVNSVAFHPAGRRIVSAGNDWTLKVWDWRSRPPTGITLEQPSRILSVAFSPDGRFLASARADGAVTLWNAETWKELRTFSGHTDHVNRVAFSPDGRRLATAGNDATIRVWNTATGQELRTLRGHNRWVESVAFSPDGQHLVSGGWDGTVKLWDAPPVPESSHPPAANSGQ